MDDWTVDYQSIASSAAATDYEAAAAGLAAELPPLWCRAYEVGTSHPTNILAFIDNGFEYWFDFSTDLRRRGILPPDSAEDRLVAVHGRSRPPKTTRRDVLMRRFPLGPAEALGSGAEAFDRGHFIAHSIGGRYDVNLFPQQRALNRGWSATGRRFRTMESYCRKHPGTYCFARPLYAGLSAHPVVVEFGVLRQDRFLWVDRFDNAEDPHTLTRIEQVFRQIL